MTRHIPIAFIFLASLFVHDLPAGGFSCDANCISKLASLSTLALNADKAVAGSKKAAAVLRNPFHPKAALRGLKSTKPTVQSQKRTK